MLNCLFCVAGLACAIEEDPRATVDPPYYVRRDTWQETLWASREALLRFESEQAAARSEPAAPRFGPWYALGPIPLPEKRDVAETIVPAFDLEKWGVLAGSEARYRWAARFEQQDGWVHTLHSDRGVSFCYRAITAPVATIVPIYLDACGDMTVWLDGKIVLPTVRGRIAHDLWSPDVQVKPAELALNLSQSRHELLVRIALDPKPRISDAVDPWRKATEQARRPWGTIFTGHSTEAGPALDYEKLAYGEVAQLYFSTFPVIGPQADSATRAREELWQLVRRDFPDTALRREMEAERRSGMWRLDWSPGDARELAERFAVVIDDLELRAEAMRLAARAKSRDELWQVRELFLRSQAHAAGERLLPDETRRRELLHQFSSLRLAILDLTTMNAQTYPRGDEFLARLDAIEKLAAEATANRDAGLFAKVRADLDTLRSEALLANPLLNFDRLILVKRGATQFQPSLPFNWASNASLSKTGYDNELSVLSPVSPAGSLSTLYRPEGGRFVGDVDLHWDADRLLFSMSGGDDGCWHVFEIHSDGTGLRQVSRDQGDVDSFDACYLPEGRIMFCSTASFAGVPCVRGRDYVAVLYRMDADGGNVRQLTFEQDQDWCPTVLGDGRVLYTRWEYTDIPHFFSRRLFQMNPDGTGQRAMYGSNSYWPNGIFYARPMPNHPTKLVGIVTGHHVARRSGELVLFDPAQGSHEADGVVQRIPGRGQKVEPVINDRLVAGTWPRFLQPLPLSDKYFLVSCKLNETTPWAIYLVDVFDNMLLIHEDDTHDLLEPIPLRPTPRPPTIPDTTDWTRSDAVVHVTDVYAGRGLDGVPRGQVKKLRLIAYHYAYQNMADDSRAIGVNSSWDVVKQVLGTVPVYEDGSAMFRVPANTPISLQPLDERGRALQLMRSWMTAMPGETQSCVGCHAPPQTSPPPRATLAEQRGVSEIAPWLGTRGGFSFHRDVKPVLDRYCVGCHDGQPRGDVATIPNLSRQPATDEHGFSPAYLELQRYVRRPGPESDIHLLAPAEYHANTSELVQLLEKGHRNVQLDAAAWQRLVTWIDLNAPFHGTWQEAQGCERVGTQRDRRRELRRTYAGIDEDPETIPPESTESIAPILPPPLPETETASVPVDGWPFDAAEARRRQAAAGPNTTRTIDLGNGVKLELVLIPAGEFDMGDTTGEADERPTRIQVTKPFWMGRYEVTNEQFAQFTPRHDSRFVQTYGITSTPGFPLNLPRQPAVRVSWDHATAFCSWLSEKAGEQFTLPTEAEWEYACRAGIATPFSYGDLNTDFSRFANLGDRNLEHFRDYSHNSKQAWLPRDDRFDDGQMVAAPVGSYAPNAWGLHDMHGNVWEWTRSTYQPFALPSPASDSPTETRGSSRTDRQVVRGGSWHDRPHRARSSFRLGYPAWQGIYNVGFRVVCEIPQ